MDWTLAERMGWTLEYIDSLPMARIHEYLQIIDGRNKATEQRQRSQAFFSKARRGRRR